MKNTSYKDHRQHFENERSQTKMFVSLMYT